MEKLEKNYIKEQKYIRAKKKMKSIKGFYVHLMVYLVINAFIIIAQLLDGEGWGIFYDWGTYGTFIFWGIGLFFHGFSVFGMDLILGKTWEEDKIKKIMNREKKDFWE